MGARMDAITIGQDGMTGHGNLASRFMAMGKLDAGTMRPFVNLRDGHTYISVYVGGPKDKPTSYRNQRLNTNGTLRRDEWKHLDEAVLAISRTRLGGVQHIIGKGLTYNIANAMGSTVLEYHDISDAMVAEMTMDGVSRGKGDRVIYSTKYLPLPIVHVDYEINHRVLMASRNMGNPLDTSQAEAAARKVLEKLEELLFTSPSTAYAFGDGTIRGFLDESNRNAVSFATNGAWNASAKTGANIIEDVLAMKQAAIDAKHFGPYTLFIPTEYETVLDGDYDTSTPGTTIRERILKISSVDDILVVDTLTAANVLLVQMSTDTVRIVNGMALTNVEWETEGGMVTKYKVMAIQVPQVRADKAGNSGVVHLTA